MPHQTCRHHSDCDACSIGPTKRGHCRVDHHPCEKNTFFSPQEIVEQFKKKALMSGVPLPAEYADLVEETFWKQMGE